nr:hypothetical protein [Polyangiaceae bacterium]
MIAEPRHLVDREGPRQVSLQHQQRPQLLRLSVARPQQPGDPLRGDRHQRVVQIFQDQAAQPLADPLGQLVAQQRVQQQPADHRRERPVRREQAPQQPAPGGPQIRLRVGQEPRQQQRPRQQRPVRHRLEEPRPGPTHHRVGAVEQLLDQLVRRRRAGQQQRLAAQRLHLRQRVLQQGPHQPLGQAPQPRPAPGDQRLPRPRRPVVLPLAQPQQPRGRLLQQRPPGRLRERGAHDEAGGEELRVRVDREQHPRQRRRLLRQRRPRPLEPAVRLRAPLGVGAAGEGSQNFHRQKFWTMVGPDQVEDEASGGLVGALEELDEG